MILSSPHSFKKTPRPLTFFIIGMLALSVILFILNRIGLPIAIYLGISATGFSRLYLWEGFSYLFVLSGVFGSWGDFIFSSLFNCFFIWVVGTALCAEIGLSAFFRLYLINGILTGFIAGLIAYLGNLPGFLLGPFPAILATLMIWNMYFKEMKLNLFLIFPLKAKWIVCALLILCSLTHLIEHNFCALIALWIAYLMGYLYGVLVLGLTGPFAFTKTLDLRLQKVSALFKRYQTSDIDSKLIDLRTKRPFVSDSAFLDAMLDKVKKEGENSLTWMEKRRLKRIGKKNKRT